MSDPFSSARLVYRAIETPDDNILFQKIHTDPQSFQNSNIRLIRPQSSKDAAEYQRVVAEDMLLGVVICLPSRSSDPQSNPIAIGEVHLTPVRFPQHRHTELGIDILSEHQGKGYGTEAIEWALEWAFNVGGMHRVGIRAFEWNYGARKLYERIGFKHEGTSREHLFHNGRFWDDYQYGMLDREWKDIKANNQEHSKR